MRIIPIIAILLILSQASCAVAAGALIGAAIGVTTPAAKSSSPAIVSPPKAKPIQPGDSYPDMKGG